MKRGGRDRSERGAIMVMFSLVLALLLGFSAFAVDLGYDRQAIAHLQSGADAGALAGSQELPTGAADATKAATARTTAANYAVKGLFDGPTPALSTPTCSGDSCTYTINTVTLTVTSPYTPPSGLGAGVSAQNLIFVQACQPGGNFFRKFLSSTVSTLCRSSVARKINSPSGFLYGLVTLDPTHCASMSFAGNSDTVLSSNGGVAVNSECSDGTTGALDSSGSSWGLHASFIGVVGTATLAPCSPPSNCTSTIPTQGIPHFSDPLALTAPAQPLLSLPCPGNNPDVQLVLPGYYADNNGCSFGGNNTYIFFPGLYYFKNGFSTEGGAILLCSAINLVLPPAAPVSLVSPCGQPSWNQDGTVNNPGGPMFYVPNGTVKMNGNGAVNLPGNANYKGVTIYQSSCSSGSQINGTATFQIGSIYAPCAAMGFNGTAGSPPNQVNVNGLVVANQVAIGGSFDFNINVPGTSPVINLGEDMGLEY